ESPLSLLQGERDYLVVEVKTPSPGIKRESGDSPRTPKTKAGHLFHTFRSRRFSLRDRHAPAWRERKKPDQHTDSASLTRLPQPGSRRQALQEIQRPRQRRVLHNTRRRFRPNRLRTI